jgi:hypothetical protein
MPYVSSLTYADRPLTQGLLQVRFGRTGKSTNRILMFLDNIEGTLRGKLAAQAGLESANWRQIANAHPDVQDPFSRVVGASSEIADASLTGFIDAFYLALDHLEPTGQAKAEIDGIVAQFNNELDHYYRYTDPVSGAACVLTERGTWETPSGGRLCQITKVQGGATSLVKQMVTAGLESSNVDVQRAWGTVTNNAIEKLARGPRRLYEKLNTTAKVVLLLATAAAATVARRDQLPVTYDRATRTLRATIPGVGAISVSEGKVESLSLTLPSIEVRKATVRTAIRATGSEQSFDADIVVPVRNAQIKAGTTVARTTGSSRVRQELRASITTPVTPAQTAFLSAGVTVPIDRRGRRVEIASSPTLQATISGQLPTLNRRVAYNQRARREERDRRAAHINELRNRRSDLQREVAKATTAETRDPLILEIATVTRELEEVYAIPSANIEEPRKLASVAPWAALGLTSLLLLQKDQDADADAKET